MSPHYLEVDSSSVAEAVAKIHGLRGDLRSLAEYVRPVVEDVRLRGDEAILEYARRFDGVSLEKSTLRVQNSEMDAAFRRVGGQLRRALEKAEENIRALARLQLSRLRFSRRIVSGVEIVQRPLPLASVGCYVPGGSAAYPSTALMTSIPAKVAGVERVVVCTPAGRDGRIPDPVLAALKIVGVDEVYRVGGPHAIAAMAYGTETIQAVDKIVGPGGPYVTAAKYVVSADVAVDMLAGATELVVYAEKVDEAEDAAYEVCAQAEHSRDTVVGVVTTSREVADEVSRYIGLLLSRVERSSIVSESWTKNGFIAICDSVSTAARLINGVAPEHLAIVSSNPKRLASKIVNAGLISIGRYTSPALCDYIVGANHVLPTHGLARVRAGLGVYDFVKTVSTVRVSKGAARRLGGVAAAIARAEGLECHAVAVERWRR
ncbi:Histidinol dehydrogenase [archaeon HR01]|nr:Histidinol dehydrogenase [archaeon HR01]